MFREQVAANRKPKGRQEKANTNTGTRHKRSVHTPEKRTSGRSSSAVTTTTTSSTTLPTEIVPSLSSIPAASTSTSAAAVAAAAVDEEGSILIGKLCGFRLPIGYQITFYTCLSSGEKIQKKGKVTAVGTTASTSTSTSNSVSSSSSSSVNSTALVTITSNPVSVSTVSLSDSTVKDDNQNDNQNHHENQNQNKNNSSSSLSAGITNSTGVGISSVNVPLSSNIGCKVTGKGFAPVNLNNLPDSGFFGLDEYDIRTYLEALPGSEQCANYHYTTSAEIRDQLINSCKADLYRINEKKSIDERLVNLILKERKYWEDTKNVLYREMREPYVHAEQAGAIESTSKSESGISSSSSHVCLEGMDVDTESLAAAISLPPASSSPSSSSSSLMLITTPTIPPPPADSSSTSTIVPSELALIAHTHPLTCSKADFSPLFPSGFSAKEGETAIALWDFLDYSKAATGDLSFSFEDIIKCIPKPESNVPT